MDCNDENETENSTKKTNLCKYCSKQYKSFKSLKKHEETHKYEFQCKICLKKFKTLVESELHEKQKHINKTKKKKCGVCPNIVFNTEEEFLLHINHEMHKKNCIAYFMCSDCGKQFKTKSELTNHINSKCGTIKQYKCQVCNQELMTAGSLHNHMLRHTGEPNFMCRFCAKLFLTAGQLKVHERIHTQEKAFICNVCGKGFCHRQSLITHSTLHTGIKPYQCENCSNSFSCVGNLLKHRKTHADSCGLIPLRTHRVRHPSTRMKVKVNTPANSKLKQIEKEKALQEKLNAIKEQKMFGDMNGKRSEDSNCTESQQNECTLPEITEPPLTPNDKLFTSQQENEGEVIEPDSELEIGTNLNGQIENSDYDDGIVKNDVDFSIQDDFLNDCDNSTYFDESRDLTSAPVTQFNEEFVEETKKSKKSKCDKGLSEKKNVVHLTKYEIAKFIKERGINEGENIHCKYCSKSYNNPKWLLRHEKKHNENLFIEQNDNDQDNQKDLFDQNNTFRCSCCKASFSTKDECKAHQANIHADMLSCQDCDKIFSNPDSLRSHKNIFHKGLPRKVYTYVCERCGQQFKQKASLLYHEQNKCGSGPLVQCEVCGKNFSSVHVRKSHMRVHDTEKRLLCKFCGKCFHWKGQLKIHERSHTGEKPFTCLYCPKAFAYRESLITHSSLHTGIKPHLCEACGSRFSCIGNLIKHRATHASTCGIWYNKNKK